MSKYEADIAPSKTIWEVGSNGDLICMMHNDPAWRTVTGHAHEFPASAEDVARLMNNAFRRGLEANAKEVRAALGIKS